MVDKIEHIPIDGDESNTFTKASDMSVSEEIKSDVSFISENEYDKDRHNKSIDEIETGITKKEIKESVNTGKQIANKIPGHSTFHESSMDVFWSRLATLQNNTNYDSIVVTDTDPDGKGVAALYKYEYGDSVLSLPASYRYGVEPLKALRNITKFIEPDITIHLCDIGPNTEHAEEWIDVMGTLQETNPIRIRDHHERVDEIYDAFDDMDNVDYVLDQSVCATIIVLREDITNPSTDIVELAAITNVQDMHIPKSPHFDVWVPQLRMASRALSFGNYVTSASKHGIGFLNIEKYDTYFDEYRRMMKQKEEIVLETLDTITVEEYKIGFVYGDSHPDRPAEVMKQKYECDIACLLKPNGRMSIRSDINTAPFSHEIAELFGGGGHSDSAGCVVFEMYTSEPPLPKEEHYNTQGKKQREIVEEKIRELITER